MASSEVPFLKTKKGKRKTIGFLINELHDRYQTMICPGIMDGAKKRNYNLIGFVGKSLESPSIFEKQENVIYKLACEKNIDGLLILTGAIGNYVNIEKLKTFCNQYKPIPIVCIAIPIKGIPSIWTDNISGIRELVTHFIKVHYYKRIVFIRGPSNNPEAELRYKIFQDVLFKNNIPFNPELTYEGNFLWSSGIEAVKCLLDKKKVKFDAVLAANDEMLIGVYRELIRRGINIPEEVAIGGFDNIEETRILTPQITTVSQQLYEEGMKAVELLDALLEGKTVPDLFSFPSKLIVRQSCGCKLKNYINDSENNPISFSRNETGNIKLHEIQRNLIMKQLIEDAEFQSNTPKEYNENKMMIKTYLNAFIDDIENKSKNKFIEELTKITGSSKEYDFNLEFLKILFFKLYQYISPLLIYSHELTFKAYNLYNSANSILLDSLSRHNQNMIIRSRDYNRAILNLTKTLSTTFDLESLRDVIIMLLPTLNISFCFIALYEDYNESQNIQTSKSKVFLNFKADNPDYDHKKEVIFDSQQLIPDKLLKRKKRFNLVAFPLVTENDHFGFIVFDYDQNRDTIIYETLQGHISSSLKGASLIEMVKKQTKDLFIQKDELSKSLEKLRRVMGGFINSMSLLVETRDPYTAGHQVRVADLARTIAVEMGLTKDQIEGIRISGVLHDLGKLYIPSQILNKPGNLIEVELEFIKIHPLVGYNILKSVDFPWPIADIILQHHERIDGSGYPYGLKGNKILIEAQIICIADVVEAMASHRPYRAALGIEAALDEITKNSGKLYNPRLVDCCIRIFKEKKYKFKDMASTFQYPLFQ